MLYGCVEIPLFATFKIKWKRCFPRVGAPSSQERWGLFRGSVGSEQVLLPSASMEVGGRGLPALNESNCLE